MQCVGDESWSTQAWVLGYLSAVNTGDPDFLKQVDPSAIFAWIDNYCRSKPLDQVVDAANGLVSELARRAVKGTR